MENHADTWYVKHSDNRLWAFSGARNKKQVETKVKVLPRAGAIQSSILQNSAQNELLFDISGGNFDVLDKVTLKYTLANSHASAACTLLDGFSLIDEWNVYCDGQLIQTGYGVSDRAFFCLGADPNQAKTVYDAVGISDTTFASNLSVPSLGTVDVRVPIKSFLNSEVPFWHSQFSWRLGIKLRGGAGILMTGNTPTIANITMTDVSLTLDGSRLDEAVKRQIDAALQEPVNYLYNSVGRESIAVGAATAATAYQISYKTQGRVSSIFMYPAESAATNQSGGNGGYAPTQQLTSWEFMQNGSVVDHKMSDGEYKAADRKFDLADLFPNSKPATLLNYHLIVFSEDVISAIIDGGVHGSLPCYSRDEYVRLTPSTTYTSLQLTLYSNVQQHIQLDFANKKMLINKNFL
jgi:hypothetical protein